MSETVNNPDPDSFRPQNQRSRTQNPKSRRGLTPRSALAKQAGTTPGVIGRFLKGERDLRLAIADKLAAVLDLQLSKRHGRGWHWTPDHGPLASPSELTASLSRRGFALCRARRNPPCPRRPEQRSPQRETAS
ncbi:MAG: helix-turn-helix domain-containing protein [Isosphaeraceae bacterium]